MTNLTILLVEDNATDEKITLRALAAKKIEASIEVARDGQEALDYLFGETRHIPNLILLDIKLPRLSGIEVLEEIRKREETSRIPVVMLTSSTDAYDIAACYRLGATSYVRKSEDFETFMDHVGVIGTYWMVINQLRPE
jgi:CheY-like chemotaxis protein